MLNFKNTSVAFVAVLSLLLILSQWLSIPVFLYWIAVLIFLSILVYGSSRINSGYFMPVFCNSSNNSKSIAITFDDGPVPGKTEKILDILKLNNTPAAFFCIGKKVESQKEILGRIDKEGHLIGNHSYSHSFFFDFYSAKRIAAELKQTNSLVKIIINKEMRFFRPPYGVTTPNIAKAVKRNSFSAIGWSVRSMDTVSGDSARLLKKSTVNLKSGDIVLFHDTVDVTVQVLQSFIDKVKEMGFSIVRLDHLLNLQAYE